MLSRVADSLYWIGRYAERAETNAHIIDLQLDQMLERSNHDPAAADEWRIVLSLCGYIEQYNARFDNYANVSHMINYLLNEEENFNAVLTLITYIRNNARNSRDIIPNDLWVAWNELYLQYIPLEKRDPTNIQNVVRFLTDVRKTALIATGVIDSLLTRDECYLFIKIGKWIERSEKTALIVQHLLERNHDLSREFRVNFALQLTNANEEYTRRFRTREADEVLNFLMGDLKCTRSVAYGMRKIKTSLYDLEGGYVRFYAQKMIEAIEQLEQLVQINAKKLSVSERKEWVNEIRQKCTNFGPIFSETYYLTKPILVD